MFSHACRHRSSRRHSQRGHFHGMGAMMPSGNSAFDAYKSETLRRLEQEQTEFESFLERLREAKDQAEFDQFMEDRSRRAAEEARNEARDQARRDDTGPAGA